MTSKLEGQNINFAGTLSNTGAAKGSLLVSDVSGNFELVTPSIDGKVLVSDAAESSGTKWGEYIYQQTNDDITPVSTSVNSQTSGNNTNSFGNCTDSDISSSSNCTIADRAHFSTINSSDACIIEGARTNRCSIHSSETCDIHTNGGAGTGRRCMIMASDNSYIGESGGKVAGNNMAIIGCSNVDMGYWSSGTLCTVAAFDGLPHPGGGANANKCFIAAGTNGVNSNSFAFSTILGSNWNSSHFGHFMFTDIGGGTTHSSFANHSFSVRCVGGARFLTNTANTTGVTLAAGTSAWAAVSDKNLKENFKIVDCEDTLERVKLLPIYEYNYIGNPQEIKCIGPTAQDWHSIVTPLDPIIEEIQDPKDPNKRIKVEKDAKDKLKIEDRDLMGVCLASIKGLENRNVNLKEEYTELKRTNCHLKEEIVSLKKQNEELNIRLLKLEEKMQ